MSKIKTLQLLVYITFALFVLQDAATSAVKGFKEGWEDGYYAGHHNNQQRGPLVSAVLNGGLITHHTANSLKINKDQTLEAVSINADIRLSHAADTTPWWLTAIHFLVVMGTAVILFLIAFTINKVILKISNGTMFDEDTIGLIRKIGSLLVLYAVADYAFQRIDHLKDTLLIRAPLQAIDTTSFNFPVLICAMLVYLIAEAFKQGAFLKQEQELTI